MPINKLTPATANQINMPTASEKRRGWIFLLLASVFEIVFALSNNASQGFTVLWPSIATIVAASFGIFFLSVALKSLDVSIGYTVWVGIGSVGVIVFGTIIFAEQVTLLKSLCFALIVGGIIGLKLADSAQDKANTLSAQHS